MSLARFIGIQYTRITSRVWARPISWKFYKRNSQPLPIYNCILKVCYSNVVCHCWLPSNSSVSVCGSSNAESVEGNTNNQSRQSSDYSPGVDSDNPSTDVDSGRESDDAARSEPSSERPRKKKQRTTFSPIEVCELEKVFAQRPYLMPEDEDELVQKLGLTARNIRVRILSVVSFYEDYHRRPKYSIGGS